MEINKMITIAFRLVSFALCLILSACAGCLKNTESYDAFIGHMVIAHQYEKSKLDDLFESVTVKDEILKKITTPAESLPWYKYRKIFMTDARIESGVKFWQDNEKALLAVEKQYGVPPEIIIAIIGVETSYGQNTGKHRVIDALSTLAFAYPPRSKFFLGELENFLLLCREENLNPLEPTGSYAGAMGIPQFMPSSYKSYAADFDGDNKRDIWHNASDVIASIGRYFAEHGWQKNQIIALPTVENETGKTLLSDNLKPNLRLVELQSLLDKITMLKSSTDKIKLLLLKQEHGEELWATLDNFYVITRYNHSPLYAMAVYQLSQAISNRRNQIAYE